MVVINKIYLCFTLHTFVKIPQVSPRGGCLGVMSVALKILYLNQKQYYTSYSV